MNSSGMSDRGIELNVRRAITFVPWALETNTNLLTNMTLSSWCQQLFTYMRLTSSTMLLHRKHRETASNICEECHKPPKIMTVLS